MPSASAKYAASMHDDHSGLLASLALSSIDKELCTKSYREYVELAWPILEPSNPFIGGWHIDATCEHLQAVSDGQIRFLIINMPPRHCKSLNVAVFWPTWEWGPNNHPELRYLYSSYADSISIRDSRHARIVIQSPWYQANWGDRFELVGDQNEKKRYENDKMGYRIATTVRGLGTGEGGDRICVDDPHNVVEGESKKKRGDVLTWWDESMSSRGNNPDTAVWIVVMQRVNEEDLSGHILAKEMGYEHLCLPARYEGSSRIVTSLGIVDPRTKEGEPLWKELYHDENLKRLEKGLGSQYAIAGQLQQRPAPREGGAFSVSDFIPIEAKVFKRNEIAASVRYWDKAGTKDDGAYTAGCLMHRCQEEDVEADDGAIIPGEIYFVIEDMERGQWEAPQREKVITHNLKIDNGQQYVTTWVEEEPGSGGKESAQATVRRNPKYTVRTDKVTGAKEIRAEPYETAVAAGQVRIIIAPWNREFLDEHKTWPNGKNKDQVDCSGGAYTKLNEETEIFVA